LPTIRKPRRWQIDFVAGSRSRIERHQAFTSDELLSF
jgi:hypothetical protein